MTLLTDFKTKHSLVFDDEGREVEIPQGMVVKQEDPGFSGGSSFSQSEYVVYDEGQVRIRYVLLFSR